MAKTPTEEKPPVNDEEQEDASEEEDSSESEDEEGEASKEEGSKEEEDEVEQFYDPAKVPPPLRGAFKDMQAKYTRKMQGLAQDVRNSEAFQELLRMPEFKLFAKDLEEGNPYGHSGQIQNGNNRGSKGGDEGEDGSLEVGEGKVNMNALVKALMPHLSKAISAEMAPMRDMEAKRSLRQLERDDPNFDDYRPGITRLMRRHPTMTLEEAYGLVSGKSEDDEIPRPRKKPDAEAIEKAKKTRTEGSGAARGSGVSTVTPKTAKTLREAIEWAAGQPGVRK